MAFRLADHLAFIVQLLTEVESHTPPAFVAIVIRWACFYTPAIQKEIPARHTLLWVVGLKAVAKALCMAALASWGTALRLACGRTHWRREIRRDDY